MVKASTSAIDEVAVRGGASMYSRTTGTVDNGAMLFYTGDWDVGPNGVVWRQVGIDAVTPIGYVPGDLLQALGAKSPCT